MHRIYVDCFNILYILEWSAETCMRYRKKNIWTNPFEKDKHNFKAYLYTAIQKKKKSVLLSLKKYINKFEKQNWQKILRLVFREYILN